jgi:hypothetical protein
MTVLLEEFIRFDDANIKLLSEGTGEGPKNLYMEGIFLQGGLKNHNGRVYPVDQIRRAVDEINHCIEKDNGVPGELDHPQELQIHLERVSHSITKMWMDGPNGMGKLKLLPTPCGQIAKTLLESGVKLGVSSRGSGNVDSLGNVSDFSMLTVDIVAKPSAPSAYPVPVYEALNHRRFGNNIMDLAESVRHDASAQKYLKSTLLRWVDELKI